MSQVNSSANIDGLSIPAVLAKTDTVDDHERTPLLTIRPQTQDHVAKGQDVHYKNIEGHKFWPLYVSILMAYFLVYFDSFFMASSHPVITSYFHASNAASWLSTVFFLSSTIFGPFYGRISDVTGRRPMYLFALVMFALTTAWCGAANSIGSFIAARFFCGLGAGGVATMSNIIMSDIIKIQYRGIYQSYLNICFSLGNGTGAALGGLLCERLGWRAAFFVQIPLIILLIIFAQLATPTDLGPSLAKAEGKGIAGALASFDFGGAITLSLMIAGVILGINLGGNVLPWTHPIVITALAVSLVALTGLVVAERKAIRPLLPLSLLSTVPLGNLNWGNALGQMLSATINFNVPLFLQAVKQVSPTTSGILLLSPLLGIAVTSVAVGYAINWTRKLKPFAAAGVVAQLVGTIACGMLDKNMPTVVILLIIPWVLVGQGFFFPTSTVSTLAMSDPDDQAVIVTTLNLSRSLGNIFGVAISSWILQNALLLFLRSNVTGDSETKEKVIQEVRRSIKAIKALDPIQREQVIEAYAQSLRITFLSIALFGVALCALVLPIRFPDLPEADATESENPHGARLTDEETVAA